MSAADRSSGDAVPIAGPFAQGAGGELSQIVRRDRFGRLVELDPLDGVADVAAIERVGDVR